MIDPFSDIKQRLTEALCCEEHSEIRTLNADPWVISSLLQKSIRRGETEMAQNAVHTLLGLRGSAIWPRLILIAFEDLGAGAANLVAETVAAGIDGTWRKSAGGDAAVAKFLVGHMADAPKDRSADYLFCAAKDHPEKNEARDRCERSSLADNLCAVAHESSPLIDRAIAACIAGGVERSTKGDLADLLQSFRAMGAPEELVAATGVAAVRLREPIVLMVPLVWCAAKKDGAPAACRQPVPLTEGVDGVPLYALDKHTRAGREAIRRFSQKNNAVRACLEEHVPTKRRNDAAYMAAFYTDAAPVALRFSWSQSLSLEALGTEADFMKVGVPRQAISPLLQAFRENLPHLNDVRAECLVRSQGAR